jgi:hypothetical protein
MMQYLELPIGSTAVRQSFATWVLERIKIFHYHSHVLERPIELAAFVRSLVAGEMSV